MNFKKLLSLLGAMLVSLGFIGSAPAQQPAAAPKSAVVVLTEANFAAEVENSKIPVLIDFSASWCGPCQQLAPKIEQLAKEYQGKVKVCKVDIDDAPKLARKYKVRVVPTLVFLPANNQGVHSDTTTGNRGISDLRSFVNRNVTK